MVSVSEDLIGINRDLASHTPVQSTQNQEYPNETILMSHGYQQKPKKSRNYVVDVYSFEFCEEGFI
jgi:hypothetical protein